jgi:hypothetical protein
MNNIASGTSIRMPKELPNLSSPSSDTAVDSAVSALTGASSLLGEKLSLTSHVSAIGHNGEDGNAKNGSLGVRLGFKTTDNESVAPVSYCFT